MKFIPVISIFIITLYASIESAELAKELLPYMARDTLCKVWVVFKDKKNVKKCLLSKSAAIRRAKVHYQENVSDLPINEEYIKQIELCGAKLRHTFKWENSASFLIKSQDLKKIASIPFVKEISLVNTFNVVVPEIQDALFKRKITDDSLLYGASFNQFNLVNIPEAQKYLKMVGFNFPGEGVLIAFFDTGFRLDHNCFSKVKQGRIKAIYDFVDNDTTVADPDSVVNNKENPFHRNDEHGSQTLSLIAGYDPGKLIGAAWGAQFVLARTENSCFNSVKNEETEIHSEEDNWAAAVVWAESLGVDIISSSLGYRDGFQDTVAIKSGDTIRIVNDYNYKDLDGKTTIISKAAMGAVQRGIIIVSAMGNEGSDKEGTLGAPADVDGVISVGALDKGGQKITSFSSTGPTSDGRIKPDLVAQGNYICVPDIYGKVSDYALNNGTSFSTPIIAGICALIVQAIGRKDSEKVKFALFNSCEFLPQQTTIDNKYGRGLPDALKACMIARGDQADKERTLSEIQFRVFPNLIKDGKGSKLTFAISKNNENINVDLSVASVNGSILWKKHAFVKATETVIGEWDCRSGHGTVAAGMYLAVIECNNICFTKRIFIVE